MKKIIFIILLGCFQLTTYSQWNTDRILDIGRNALYFEDYVLSIQYFNQVIKIKPYLAEPYMYRAMAKIQLGDDKGAEIDASEAIDRNPFLPQAYYIRGFARRRISNYSDAVSDFSKAIEFSPNSLNLLLNRMDALLKLEKFDDAMSDLDTYMKLSAKNNAMLYEKGFILLQMKDTLGAEKAFNQFIQSDSTNTLGWSARALLYMQKQNLKDAYNDYSQAIKLKSNYVGDYINRGIINVQRKNYRQALTDYDQAIKIDKKSDLAYYNRGLLRANLGDNNNALSDLNKVLELDTANIEARFRKAMLENTVGQYRNAIADYKIILVRYPYFLPAYIGLADAEDGLGNKKEAYRYRLKAYEIEKDKDNIKRKSKDIIKTDNKLATNVQKGSSNKKTEMFNRFATQNIDDSQSESKYKDETRGNVQDNYADVINESNFYLSYYAKPDQIKRTNLYQPMVEDYNKLNILNSNLKITNKEIPLTSDLINLHFEAINNISIKISENETEANLYFKRSLEFALVQDFHSAIEDLNKTLSMNQNFALAYFSRANIRYKLVEYMKSTAAENAVNSNENNIDLNKRLSMENKNKFEVEMIMRDYDKVIELQPNFAFAYYNKANILCTQKDYRTAISNFSKAIECDADFAEAYFNRGLTYIFIGQDTLGLADLSKAGELGIYQSYNLMQRFKN